MKLEKLTDTCYATSNNEFFIAEEESGDYWMVVTKDDENDTVRWLHSGDDMEACAKWLKEHITEH